MRNNWKRFSVGAFLLASLSLLLFGCGGSGSSQLSTTTAAVTATKSLSGIVSGSNGLRVANAKVTAFAISQTGVWDPTKPISLYSVNTDLNGAYTLQIPANTTSAVLIQAKPGALAKLAPSLAKLVFASTLDDTIYSVVSQGNASSAVIPQTMVSVATQTVFLFATEHLSGTLGESVRTATVTLEAFFGLGFDQVPPPATAADTTPTNAQLTVFIQALAAAQASDSTVTLSAFAADLQPGGSGLGTMAAALTTAVNAVVVDLNNQGALPDTFQSGSMLGSIDAVATAAPVLPDLTDTTAPSAPGNVTASAVTSQNISLTWTPSLDNTGGTGLAGYVIYRADSSQNYLIIDTVSPLATAYSDTTASGSTTYTYKVVAFDVAHNFSVASNISAPVTTPTVTYSVSGNIALSTGGGLAGASVSIGSTTAKTDDQGNFTLTGIAPGTFTLRPSASSFYTFTPATQSVTVGSANVVGVTFNAVFTGAIVTGAPYPDGTIMGGISYPSGAVINGVTYPTATVSGGVTYPTGTVIGGLTYPAGVVIDGVSYPAGTVVGGVAFPVGAATGGLTPPSGVVIGNATYPTGTVVNGVITPSGISIGAISVPSGIVVGDVTYPSGVAAGGTVYPTGGVAGSTSYPAGTLIGGITYPTGAVIGGVYYPTATVIGGVTYPTGTVIGGTSYPNGVVIGGVTYPSGTVVGGIAFPVGSVNGGTVYPTGTVIGGISYPTGTVIGGVY